MKKLVFWSLLLMSAPLAAQDAAETPASTEAVAPAEVTAPAEVAAPAEVPVPVEAVPETAPLTQAELFASLPDFCQTPDSFTLAPWGDVLLSCPNYADPTHPPVIVRIAPDNQIRLWAMCPVNSKTGNAGPMGMSFGPDGNLYISDNAGWSGNGQMGRILRLIVNENHRPVACEIVAYDFAHPNGLRVQGDYIYVTHSLLDKSEDDGKQLSGVFRLPLNAKNVKIDNSVKDPHLIAVVKTENPDCQYGLNGLCFDKDGNLYVGNFGDGTILKITFDENGTASEPILYAQGPEMLSNDGMVMGDDGVLYVCDFTQNAILAVLPDGKIVILAKNGDTDGNDGLLDEPGDLFKRGSELLIANFDNVPGPPYVNTKHDGPATISIINLDGIPLPNESTDK